MPVDENNFGFTEPPFKPTADRYNSEKPELSYILSAPGALKGLAEVFSYGATKYSRDNWKKGFWQNQLLDSLMRHLLAVANGEELDLNPETGKADNGYSGLPHVDHLLWNALILAEQYRTLPRVDKEPTE
jgi:hypothetical protein